MDVCTYVLLPILLAKTKFDGGHVDLSVVCLTLLVTQENRDIANILNEMGRVPAGVSNVSVMPHLPLCSKGDKPEA